ncbi:MAG: L,D-transpeptidase family protein [Pseudomonadota bacterium]|nr:L,D-transpeptidase family protein [Pseudomonadota bacterium]
MKNIFSFFLLAFGLFWFPYGHAELFEIENLNEQLIGNKDEIIAKYEDTFVQIARNHNLGFEELLLANPNIDPWLPGEGSSIVLPKQFILPQVDRLGIVINLPEYRLYYYYKQDGIDFVASWPISIGKVNWGTPLLSTFIAGKKKKPSWYPPDSVRAEHAAEGDILPAVVLPGPDNPLGEFALRLGLPSYLIHGTNRPAGIGMRVTHGCIRLFPEDIEWLFNKAALQTPVRIINQPIKFGWSAEGLYIEAHPMLEDKQSISPMTLAMQSLIKATDGNQGLSINWDLVEDLVASPSGLPFQIGERIKTL